MYKDSKYKLEKYKHKLMHIKGGGSSRVLQITNSDFDNFKQKNVYKQEYLRLKSGGATAAATTSEYGCKYMTLDNPKEQKQYNNLINLIKQTIKQDVIELKGPYYDAESLPVSGLNSAELTHNAIEIAESTKRESIQIENAVIFYVKKPDTFSLELLDRLKATNKSDGQRNTGYFFKMVKGANITREIFYIEKFKEILGIFPVTIIKRDGEVVMQIPWGVQKTAEGMFGSEKQSELIIKVFDFLFEKNPHAVLLSRLAGFTITWDNHPLLISLNKHFNKRFSIGFQHNDTEIDDGEANDYSIGKILERFKIARDKESLPMAESKVRIENGKLSVLDSNGSLFITVDTEKWPFNRFKNGLSTIQGVFYSIMPPTE